MRIVNRAQFLAMPAGTVFTKFEPHVFGDLLIKGENVGDGGFWCQDIVDSVDAHDSGEWADKLFAAVDGAEVSFDFNCERRDGQFDADQLFAVWSVTDVSALIVRLQRSIADAVTQGGV